MFNFNLTITYGNCMLHTADCEHYGNSQQQRTRIHFGFSQSVERKATALLLLSEANISVKSAMICIANSKKYDKTCVDNCIIRAERFDIAHARLYHNTRQPVYSRRNCSVSLVATGSVGRHNSNCDII
jgi:hypothetical protein